MMRVIAKGSQETTEIDDAVVRMVLSLYPEERLIDRPIFADALQHGYINFVDLQKECGVTLLPWQMFFLDKSNLEKELARIEKNRAAHWSVKLAAKRNGAGGPTSKRILDRLIRLQNYTCSSATFSKHAFCGSLKGLSAVKAAAHIQKYFGIDLANFRQRRKDSALQYLIESVQAKRVNVCQGVLTNKILPQFGDVRSVYKNTSGFVIHDEQVPYVFLPSEVNPDERDGRQIYTLVYLLAAIGLGAYSHVIGKDFKTRALMSTGTEKAIYDIASEFLLPSLETDKLLGSSVSAEKRDRLATDFKITPTAVVVTLRRRSVITADEYKELIPNEQPPRPSERKMSSPKIITSVRKFAGQYGLSAIKAGLTSGALSSLQAQYLIFGAPNKKKFRELRSQL